MQQACLLLSRVLTSLQDCSDVHTSQKMDFRIKHASTPDAILASMYRKSVGCADLAGWQGPEASLIPISPREKLPFKIEQKCPVYNDQKRSSQDS